MPVEAFFLPAGDGYRFCLFHPAQGEERGAVVYVHPFAEEMNKSRRMAALQSRALAQAGYAVLQVDLQGCGDSSGEFADASWDAWVDDVLLACRWLRGRSRAPLWLWGLRAGCLLGSEAAQRLDEPCSLLFWQPAAAGRAWLQQFLRLKVASSMLSGSARNPTEALRARLADGETIEVAGYELSARLAEGLERASLVPAPQVRRLEWLEVSARQDATLSPASAAALAPWEKAGCVVRSRGVPGPAFWQTTEIEEAPALVPATLASVDGTVAA